MGPRRDPPEDARRRDPGAQARSSRPTCRAPSKPWSRRSPTCPPTRSRSTSSTRASVASPRATSCWRRRPTHRHRLQRASARRRAEVAKAERVDIRRYNDHLRSCRRGEEARWPACSRRASSRSAARQSRGSPASSRFRRAPSPAATSGRQDRPHGKARVVRDSAQVWEGNIKVAASLQGRRARRGRGLECGIGLDFNDLKEGRHRVLRDPGGVGVALRRAAMSLGCTRAFRATSKVLTACEINGQRVMVVGVCRIAFSSQVTTR